MLAANMLFCVRREVFKYFDHGILASAAGTLLGVVCFVPLDVGRAVFGLDDLAKSAGGAVDRRQYRGAILNSQCS